MLIYLFIINAAGLILMLVDKVKAKKNLWRIPEKTIFIVAILGGAFGCILGMKTAHHKTKHLSFSIGLPVIFALQAIILILFIK